MGDVLEGVLPRLNARLGLRVSRKLPQDLPHLRLDLPERRLRLVLSLASRDPPFSPGGAAYLLVVDGCAEHQACLRQHAAVWRVGGGRGVDGGKVPSRRAICVDLIMASCCVSFAVVGFESGYPGGCSEAELASLLCSVGGAFHTRSEVVYRVQ